LIKIQFFAILLRTCCATIIICWENLKSCLTNHFLSKLFICTHLACFKTIFKILKITFSKVLVEPAFFRCTICSFCATKKCGFHQYFWKHFFKISKKSLFLSVLYFFRYAHQDNKSFSEGHYNIVGKVRKYKNDIGTIICAVRVRPN